MNINCFRSQISRFDVRYIEKLFHGWCNQKDAHRYGPFKTKSVSLAHNGFAKFSICVKILSTISQIWCLFKQGDLHERRYSRGNRIRSCPRNSGGLIILMYVFGIVRKWRTMCLFRSFSHPLPSSYPLRSVWSSFRCYVLQSIECIWLIHTRTYLYFHNFLL